MAELLLAAPKVQMEAPKGPATLALDSLALHGLAGDITKALAPTSEADDVALLATTLCAFGVLLGDRYYWDISGTRHYLRLWPVLVGATGTGRKGTSWGSVSQVFQEALGHDWAKRCTTGLTSGEGLIWAVRDPLYKTERDPKTKESIEVLDDPGVEDKRVLVKESEFGKVLSNSRRDGCTLSPVLREAWETSEGLRIMTRKSPATATGPHITVLGHITSEELMRHMSDTEVANGFANRFLWLVVRRARELPFGGSLPERDLAILAERVRRVIDLARAAPVQRLEWTSSGRRAWPEVYTALSKGAPGLVGALLSRAAPQVMRLAGLYAALDQRSAVDVPHLLAALALWEYAERSAQQVFGDRFGDPIADTIMSALSGGSEISRTAISDLFNRHASASRIEMALLGLVASGHITVETRDTGGRPATLYRKRDTHE